MPVISRHNTGHNASSLGTVARDALLNFHNRVKLCFCLHFLLQGLSDSVPGTDSYSEIKASLFFFNYSRLVLPRFIGRWRHNQTIQNARVHIICKSHPMLLLHLRSVLTNRKCCCLLSACLLISSFISSIQYNIQLETH